MAVKYFLRGHLYSYIIRSPKMMLDLGSVIASLVFPGLVIYLDGKLGTGKTTLVRGIAWALGWHEVRSPSFTLVNEYPTDPPMAHIDLYRLERSEFEDIAVEEYIDNGFFVAIEWGKPDYFPYINHWWHIIILYDDDLIKREERKVKITAFGDKAEERLKHLDKVVSSWAL